MTTDCRRLAAEATGLLRRLIATPSVSRDEKAAADIIEQFMEDRAMRPRREANNVWAVAPGHDDSRPTLLLNAHIDTVKPVASWTRARWSSSGTPKSRPVSYNTPYGQSCYEGFSRFFATW